MGFDKKIVQIRGLVSRLNGGLKDSLIWYRKGADLINYQGHWPNVKKTSARFFKTLAAYFFSLNIARKLMLGFIPLVVLLVLVSLFALFSLGRIKNHAQRTWYCFSPLKGGGRLAPREGKLELSHGII